LRGWECSPAGIHELNHHMRNPNGFIVLLRNSLAALTKDQRKEFAKSAIAGIIIAALEWISLAAIIPIFFQLVGSNKNSALYFEPLALLSWPTIFLILLAVFTIKAIGTLLLMTKQLDVTNSFYLDFSERMYSAYFKQDFVAFANINSADTFRKIKNTAFDFSNHVLHGILMLLSDVLIVIATTIFIAWLDFRILIALVILGLPTLLVYYFFKKNWIKEIDESFRKYTPEANIILSHGIESYAEAKIYHAENYFIKSFLSISAKTSDLLGKLKVLATLPGKIMEIIGLVSFIIISLLGVNWSGSPDTIVFLGLFSLAVYRIMPSFNRIIATVTQIQSYAYSIEEIKNISVGKNSKENFTDKRLPFTSTLSLTALHFKYDQSNYTIIKGFTETIQKGDFVLLNGPSGSGKTTLLNIIAGLIIPDRGNILVDGKNITKEKIPAWQNNIGYVQQSPVIHHDSILNNILFTPTSSISQERLQLAIDCTGLLELIATLPQGLETFVGEHGLMLSGGQRQRLALARALYRNPELLLLDEVTNQLDEDSKLIVLRKLKSLTLQGKTVVLSSHDPVIKNFATRIIFLDKQSLQTV
jgi:ATP-binding cassette, subfamily B, bacterial PglK